MLKKIFFIILCFLLCLSSACCSSGKNYEIKNDEIITNFSSELSISCEDTVYLCSYKNNEFCTSELEIKLPEELKGVLFSHNLEGYSLSKAGIVLKNDSYFLCENSYLKLLDNIIQTLATYKKQLKLVSSDEQKNLFKGSIDDLKFEISIEKQSGFIDKIFINSLGISYDFSKQNRL